MGKITSSLYTLVVSLLLLATPHTLSAMQVEQEAPVMSTPPKLQTILATESSTDSALDSPGRLKRFGPEQSEMKKLRNSIAAYMLTTATMMFVVENLLPNYVHPLDAENIEPLDAFVIRFGAAIGKGVLVYLASALNRFVAHRKGGDCNLFAPQITSFFLQLMFLTQNCFPKIENRVHIKTCLIDQSSVNAAIFLAQILPIIYAHIINRATGQTPLFFWPSTNRNKITSALISGAKKGLTAIFSSPEKA
jgi:hypothetical protein